MRCLVLSDTFPNKLHPWRGPYNRRQVECLASHCDVTVIDPLPWPSLLKLPEAWPLVSSVDDVLKGVPIHHPVFWYVPVLGRGVSWRGVYAAAVRQLHRMSGGYDVIMATFAYPQGMAAKALSERLGIPYVIKVRGTDLHGLPACGARRDRTAEALCGAATVIAVARNLAAIARELGVPEENIRLLPNGIDVGAFQVSPREVARRQLALSSAQRIVLFVGNLLPVKGLDILLKAARINREAMRDEQYPLLAIAGEGPMRKWLEQRVEEMRLKKHVRLLGGLSRPQVALWMNAADALVLSSRNEGCPNVVLEALCCGTPVVATRVGGVPDMLDESSGIIVPPENAAELARALREALERPWDRQALRARVSALSWEANAQMLHEILRQAVSRRKGRAA